MKTKKLQAFFEEQDFNVHLFKQGNKQCAEIEKWTNGGVDMIIALMPFTKEEFIERVENFDIDEEIELHRQGQDYKNAFTIRESLDDFTDFHADLKDVVTKLQTITHN